MLRFFFDNQVRGVGVELVDRQTEAAANADTRTPARDIQRKAVGEENRPPCDDVKQDPVPIIRLRQISDNDIPAVVSLLTRGFRRHPERFWIHLLDCLRIRAAPVRLPEIRVFCLKARMTLLASCF